MNCSGIQRTVKGHPWNIKGEWIKEEGGKGAAGLNIAMYRPTAENERKPRQEQMWTKRAFPGSSALATCIISSPAQKAAVRAEVGKHILVKSIKQRSFKQK